MSVFFAALGVIAGSEQDVEAVHEMILRAEASSPSDRFKYRRLRATNGTQLIAYQSGKSLCRPQLEIVLQRKDVGLESKDVCVLLEGRPDNFEGYTVCHYRGRDIADGQNEARKSFVMFCAGHGLDLSRVQCLTTWN